MIKATVYRATQGSASFNSFEATFISTGTQKGISKAPRIDGKSHFVSRPSLRKLANFLVTYLRMMEDDKRWKKFEDRLEITFPGDIKIFHPLNGTSRMLYPLSEKEVSELWTFINYYSQ